MLMQIGFFQKKLSPDPSKDVCNLQKTPRKYQFLLRTPLDFLMFWPCGNFHILTPNLSRFLAIFNGGPLRIFLVHDHGGTDIFWKSPLLEAIDKLSMISLEYRLDYCSQYLMVNTAWSINCSSNPFIILPPYLLLLKFSNRFVMQVGIDISCMII